MSERDMTLLELVVSLALLTVLATVTTVVSLRVLAREDARGALYELQGLARLARAEAASRNRDCRLLLDTNTRRVLVVDTMGTTTTADDIELMRASLGPGVRFRSPDSSPPITLQALGGAWFGATFDSNGIVTSGAGSVIVRSRDRHSRLTLFAAGGTASTVWNGHEWSIEAY